jgi:hypothetical protein
MTINIPAGASLRATTDENGLVIGLEVIWRTVDEHGVIHVHDDDYCGWLRPDGKHEDFVQQNGFSHDRP